MKAPWILACSKALLSFQLLPPRLVRWGFHPSPLGNFFIGLTEDDAVCVLAFGLNVGAKAHLATWQKKWPRTVFEPDDVATKKIMDRIFVRAQPVKVVITGTKFQIAVWKIIASVADGKTISYKQLAAKIKNPLAIRAAGTACGANPVPVLVPCHRILATDGSLGGFGGGLPLKRHMLAQEGVGENLAT